MQTMNNFFKTLKASNKFVQIIFGLFLLFCIISIFQVIAKAARPTGYDLTTYIKTAEAILNSSDPYNTGASFPFIYPIFIGVILIPFTFLPNIIINTSWYFLNLYCFGYILKKSTIQKDWIVMNWDWFNVRFAILFIFCFNMLQNHFLNGQINLLVLALCFAWYELEKSKKYFFASIFLSVSIAIKLTPLIFLGLLFWDKKYKSILYTSILTSIFILAPYLAFYGDLIYFKIYINDLVIHKLLNPETNPESSYYTLQVFIERIIPHLHGSRVWSLVSKGTILVLISISHIKANKIISDYRSLFVFSLYSIGILMLSPMSETHHLIFIIPSFWLILQNLKLNNLTNYNYRYIFSFSLLWFLGSIYNHMNDPWYFLSIHCIFLYLIWFLFFNNLNSSKKLG